MPPSNLVPKPLQRPHPPLWVACSRRDTIHLAATLGIGALTFSFVEADEAKAWVDDYYATIASEDVRARRVRRERQPGVRPAAHVSRRRVHGDRPRPRRQPLLRILARRTTTCSACTSPVSTDVWQEFLENRDRFGFSRAVAAQTGQQLGAQLMEQGLGLACAGPSGRRRRSGRSCAQYEDAGVDQLIFVSQAGRNRHEDICESLELFAREVMPEFHERADEDRARQSRASGPCDRRRPGPARPAASGAARLRLPRHAPVLSPAGPGRGLPGQGVRASGMKGASRGSSRPNQCLGDVPPGGPESTQAPPRSVEWWR